MEYTKYIKRQDCNWKQAAGPSGETSLNLSNEICNFLTFGLVDRGEESVVTFGIFKDEFLDAAKFIGTQLPLYRTTSHDSQLTDESSKAFISLEKNINDYFLSNTVKEYSVTIYRRKDGRIYLKGLKQGAFTVRDYLVENSSAIKFLLTDDGIELHVISAVTSGDL